MIQEGLILSHNAKLWVKTLKQFKSTVKEKGGRGRNLICRQAYSQCPFYTVFSFTVILNIEEKQIITISTEAITPMHSAGFNLLKTLLTYSFKV